MQKKIFSKIQKIHQIYRYLYDDVEGYVEVSAVYEHVGDEAPDLLLGVRVEDEGAAQVDRAVGAHGVALVGQQDHVVHEHADLAQAHLYTAVVILTNILVERNIRGSVRKLRDRVRKVGCIKINLEFAPYLNYGLFKRFIVLG